MRRFFPAVRLKELLRDPGGIPVAVALDQATANLETLREPAFEEVTRLAGQMFAAVSRGDREGLYRLSNQIFGDAAAFGWKEISGVAAGLCDLMDTDVSLNSAPVILHIQALQVLSQPEADQNTAARVELLNGLRAIARR